MTGEPCTCAAPRLLVVTDVEVVVVAPTDTPGPLCRLYLARCSACGGSYGGPFREANEVRDPAELQAAREAADVAAGVVPRQAKRGRRRRR